MGSGDMASVKDNKISTVCHRLIHTKKKNRRVTPSSICISGNNQQQKKKNPGVNACKKNGGKALVPSVSFTICGKEGRRRNFRGFVTLKKTTTKVHLPSTTTS